MENDLNNVNAHVTKADLKAEFGKFEERLLNHIKSVPIRPH